MLGFLIAFWAAPDMTAGRLLFAAATSVYILIALQLEERDLLHYFGEQYEQYCRRVPALVPRPRALLAGEARPAAPATAAATDR